MRIVSGKYKGIILNSPKIDNVRPTADKVKQAIFTKLQFDVVDSVVLDLFSGSGALGIEAISKGASEVVFVDKDNGSVLLTKSNLKKIGSNAKVHKCPYNIFLNNCKTKFDIVLIDPPYASGVYENALELLAQNNCLNENAIIVCEHPKTLALSHPQYLCVDEKFYGTVQVSYLILK